MVYDAVPLTVTNGPDGPDSYLVHVDPKGLVWTFATDTEPRHVDVIVMASTFDKKDKELKRTAQAVRGKAPMDVPRTGRIERGLILPIKVEHDPKAVRVRFVVRVTQTGREGTADLVLGGPVVAAKP